MALPMISRGNVLAGIERIRREGVPAQRQSSRYSLVHKGRRYPPKYVVSLAVEDANGRALDPEEFSGGVETNSLLRKLGFAIDGVNPSRSSTGRAKAMRAGSQEPSIARVIVRGVPGNTARGERLLLEVLQHRWPDGLRVKFLVTPGGFVTASFPARWAGGVGWGSSRADLEVLKTHAKKTLARTVTDRVVRAARGKVDVFTVGIDLLRDDRPEHAELVAVYDLSSRHVFWTGKSYPTSSQERHLVQVTDLNTHILRLAGERVLVLGCHDLNMFSPRAWANQGKHGLRRQRSSKMRGLARGFKPTIVLQHPHTTDHPGIWQTSWVGVLRDLPKVKSWASGIGYHRWGRRPRRPLGDVLAATHGGVPCIDIIVKAK
jgi:hypothetical protein